MEKSQVIQSAEVTQTHSFHSSDSTGRRGHKFHVLRKDLYIHEVHIKQESAPQRLRKHPDDKNLRAKNPT